MKALHFKLSNFFIVSFILLLLINVDSVNAAITTPHKLASTQNQLQNVTADPYQPPDPADYSSDTWSDAFDMMCIKMSKEFAYTAYLKIDWQALHDKYKPLIVKAEIDNDQREYYTALRKYITDIHENHTHVYIDNSNPDSLNVAINVIANNIGGWYQLIITKISDGSYIASYVSNDLQQKGLKPGAKILTWNGKPITQAISDTPLTWSSSALNNVLQTGAINSLSPQTKDAIEYEKLRLLIRDKIGAHTQITYQNLSTNEISTIDLTSIDDKFNAYDTLSLSSDPNRSQPYNWIWYKVINNNIGYLHIVSLNTSNDIFYNYLYSQLQLAMQEFNNRNVRAIIIDIRTNTGGNDGLSSQIVGFFAKYSFPILNVYGYNKLTDSFTYLGNLEVQLTNNDNMKYYGPVIVLTSPTTSCAAEGLALGMSKLPNVHLMSVYSSTAGTYSDMNTIKMPGDFQITEAIRRILDMNGVPIDADNDGNGGVKTDIVVPLSVQDAIDMYADNNSKDIALNYATNWILKNTPNNNVDPAPIPVPSPGGTNHNNNFLIGAGIGALVGTVAGVGTYATMSKK